MGNSNDIKKVEAALKAIKDLEVLAKEPWSNGCRTFL